MRRFIPVLISFAAWAGWSSSAAAATLLSISYTVTGGTFDGAGFAAGTVTGGSLVINTPTAAATTFACAVTCGTATVLLTGPNGNKFAATWLIPSLTVGPAAVVLGPHVHAVYPLYTGLLGLSSAGTGTFPPPATLATLFHAGAQFVAGAGTFTAFSNVLSGPFGFAFLTHVATLGSEVRTIVPEPGSAPLAGLGLLALSGYAAHRRARRSARTA